MIWDSLSWLFFGFAASLYASALSLRHFWFQTSAWDLAIFDQAIYLIGQGMPAQSSLLGFHILGDHAAFVLYPLGWLSRLIPSPALLIALQSLALASAVFPLAALARLRGLSRQATAASLAMLVLYPVLFNTAIFDFHPETLAFPLVMQALWWLERRAPGDEIKVFAALVPVLTCKVGLALLVFGMAAALLVSGRRRLGAWLLVLSVSWFAVVAKILLPAVVGKDAEMTRHAAKFGLSQPDLASGTLDWLQVVQQLLGQIFSLSSLEYLALLLLPVLYVLLSGQRIPFFATLLPFAPLLLINLAASRPALKDLVHHYSLFLVPFLALAVQNTLQPGAQGLSAYPRWLQGRVPPIVIGWSLLCFILLSRFSFFFAGFHEHWGHLGSLRDAVAMVRPSSTLLVSNHLAPQLSHRQKLFILEPEQLQRLDDFDEILVDGRHPGFRATPRLLKQMRARLRAMPQFSLIFDRDDVWLFRQSG